MLLISQFIAIEHLRERAKKTWKAFENVIKCIKSVELCNKELIDVNVCNMFALLDKIAFIFFREIVEPCNKDCVHVTNKTCAS